MRLAAKVTPFLTGKRTRGTSPEGTPPVVSSDAEQQCICNNGHPMVHTVSSTGPLTCDECHESLGRRRAHFSCARCDFDLCERCGCQRGQNVKVDLTSVALPAQVPSEKKQKICANERGVRRAPLQTIAQQNVDEIFGEVGVLEPVRGPTPLWACGVESASQELARQPSNETTTEAPKMRPTASECTAHAPLSSAAAEDSAAAEVPQAESVGVRRIHIRLGGDSWSRAYDAPVPAPAAPAAEAFAAEASAAEASAAEPTPLPPAEQPEAPPQKDHGMWTLGIRFCGEAWTRVYDSNLADLSVTHPPSEPTQAPPTEAPLSPMEPMLAPPTQAPLPTEAPPAQGLQPTQELLPTQLPPPWSADGAMPQYPQPCASAEPASVVHTRAEPPRVEVAAYPRLLPTIAYAQPLPAGLVLPWPVAQAIAHHPAMGGGALPSDAAADSAGNEADLPGRQATSSASGAGGRPEVANKEAIAGRPAVAPREPHVGPSGAAEPWLVTHGLTLRGAQLSWAILNGDKRVENRHFRMQPGWYALHTGAKRDSHESQLPLLAGVEGMPAEEDLPHSAIVGALKVSHALTLEQSKSTEPWAFGPVVNVLSAVCRLERPVPHRGALSVWRIEQDALESVREQLRNAAVLTNDISHLPPIEEAPKVFPSFRTKKAAGREGDLPAPTYY